MYFIHSSRGLSADCITFFAWDNVGTLLNRGSCTNAKKKNARIFFLWSDAMPGITAQRISRSVLFFLLAASLYPSIIQAQTPAQLLVNQFVTIDSIMNRSGQHIDPMRDDSVRLLPVFRDVLQQYTGFYAFIIADALGNINQTVSFEQLGSEFSGDLSRREWYFKPRKSHDPYFGGLIKVNGRFCLVWSKPCMRRNWLGLNECRGVVTALINVGECLKLFSEQFQQPFELAQKNHIFFHTDDWRSDASYHEEPLELADNLILTLRFPVDTGTDGFLSDVGPEESAAVSGMVPSVPVESMRMARASDQHYSDIRPLLLLGFIVGLVFASIAAFSRRKSVIRFVRALYCRFMNSTVRRTMKEPAQDRETVKLQVMSDLYTEVRARMQKYEIAKIENDVRERLHGEVRERCRREITLETLDQMRITVLKEERNTLRTTIAAEVLAKEAGQLRKEARARVLARLEKEIEEQESVLARKELIHKIAARVSTPLEALAIFEELQTASHLTVSTTSETSGMALHAVKPEESGTIPISRPETGE
jgi:hypothetical protein